MALFATNKASWARFISLVVFATFVWLAMVLTSTHTIQFYWGIIWRFTPFTMCATLTNKVCNSQNLFSKYTGFFKAIWVLFKNLTTDNWLQSMDKSIQYFIIGNTMHFILNTFHSIYTPSDRAFLHICSLLIMCILMIVSRFKSVNNIHL